MKNSAATPLSEVAIASLLSYEELYDKELVEHFYEKAKKENRLAICAIYAENKNFDMHEGERRKVIEDCIKQYKLLNDYLNTQTKAQTLSAQKFKLDK